MKNIRVIKDLIILLRSSQTVDYLNYINNKVEVKKSVSTFKDEKLIYLLIKYNSKLFHFEATCQKITLTLLI